IALYLSEQARRTDASSPLSASSISPIPPALPPLPVQYLDYTLWQRGWLQGEALAALLGYWREQLAGAPFHLELPADRPRPAARSMRGGRRRLDLSPDLAAALAVCCRTRRLTPFMALFAGFAALL